MTKSRNKKREKLKKLYEDLEMLKTLSYYHQSEDVKELTEKIRILELSL